MAAPVATRGISKEILKYLEEHSSLQLINDGNKVKCALSGHEMPCKTEAIQSYINGKKYKNLKEANDYHQYNNYKQHVVPSNKKFHEKQLFCKLTLRHLNNTPSHIEKHICGRRFQKALKRWEACQKTGEKFVPRTGRKKQDLYGVEGEKKKQKESWDAESDVDMEWDDDMSDLYPAEYLEEEEESESASEEKDGSGDSDNMEVDGKKSDVKNSDKSVQENKEKGTITSQKRKKQDSSKTAKKVKTVVQ